MNAIRKIWVGSDLKEGAMSWELGQSVRIGPRGPKAKYAKVNHIVKEVDGTYTIHIKKDNGSIVKWKSTGMDSTVEYDIEF